MFDVATVQLIIQQQFLMYIVDGLVHILHAETLLLLYQNIFISINYPCQQVIKLPVGDFSRLLLMSHQVLILCDASHVLENASYFLYNSRIL